MVQSPSNSDEENRIEITKVVVTTPLPLSSVKTELNVNGALKRAADNSSDPPSKRLFAAPLSIKPEPLNLDGLSTKDETAAKIAEQKAILLAQIEQLDVAASQLLSESVVPEPTQPVESRIAKKVVQEETVVDESEVVFVEEVLNGPRMSFQPDFAAMLKIQEDTKNLALEERERLQAEKEEKDAEVARLKAEALTERKKKEDKYAALEKEEQRRRDNDGPLIPLLATKFGVTDIIGRVKDIFKILMPDGGVASLLSCKFTVVVSTDAVGETCRNYISNLGREEEKFVSVESCRLHKQREVPENLKDRVKLLSSFIKFLHPDLKLHDSIRSVGEWLWRDQLWCEDEELARQLSCESVPWVVFTATSIFRNGVDVLPTAAQKAINEKRNAAEKEHQKLLQSLGEKEEEVRSCEQLIEIKKEKIDELQPTQK